MRNSQSQNVFYENHSLQSNDAPTISNPNDFVSATNLEHSITSGDDLSSNTSRSRLDAAYNAEIKSPPSIHHYHKKSEQREQEMKAKSSRREDSNRVLETHDYLSPQTDYIESGAELANCEKDLEHLSKLRLQTLEQIIQDKLQEIDRVQNDYIS